MILLNNSMFQCSLYIRPECKLSVILVFKTYAMYFLENIVKLPLIVCYILQIFVKTIIRL